MKKVIACLTLLIIACGAILAQKENKYESIWEGKLNFGTTSLKVVVKTLLGEDGTRTGLLDSPDQGARDIPITNITLTDDSLKFEIKSLGITYSGEIKKDSMVVVGTFKQKGFALDLNLKKVEKIAEVRRPQYPTKPYPYNEEEITFENKTANITLAGTLTYPINKDRLPAVVLVSGSGAQDRDETVFNHKFFLVLADYLTRNGMAVLRYDDRGFGKSTGIFSSATTLDFVTDALAAVEYLKTRNEINPMKIGIIGHSEGGIIAPLASTQSDDVKFIVMLAGPALSGKELIPLQTKLIMKVQGSSDDEIEMAVKIMEESFEIIVSEPDSLAAFKELKIFVQKKLSELADNEKKKPEYSLETYIASIKNFLSPWFRFFLKYDPYPTLENIKVPTLALIGSKDLQVPSKENIPLIEKALKYNGNKNYKVLELPDLNHLFQKAKTGAVSEYAQIEETISPAALKIIGDWILEVTNKTH